MKKLKLIVGLALAAGLMTAGISPAARVVNAEEELAPACKAAYACDYTSGTVVYSKNETERLPIASMCKIMTLLLSFEAADRGELSYDEPVTVSENAAGMGGSQVFLEKGLTYTAGELLKTIAVCSANDSCVAMAERVAGSESAFVDRMNARAKELGAENTLFANCTGLPKETQYSCAKDVSLMLRAMLSHEKYFEFSRVWLEDFAHPDGRTTSITNTNKLIRAYEGCDGGKTGFTNEAGFCLAATAKRGDTRLISVVLGGESSEKRFKAVSSMLDYGFNAYETKVMLDANVALEQRANVRGGRQKDVSVIAETPLKAFCKRGETGDFTLAMSFNEELKAPISTGDQVGTATLYRDGIEVCTTRLLCAESVGRLSWWDAVQESAKNWN